MIRHALALNIARLAHVGTRLIEVAQGSAIRLRQEVRDKRELMGPGMRESVNLGGLTQAQMKHLTLDGRESNV